MAFEVNESSFANVSEKAAALGCNIPTSITILPRNFDVANVKSELIHERDTPTVRILWRQAGIIETPLEDARERFPRISEHGLVEWISPAIFISAVWASQNPEAMSVALGVISNYLTDLFKGTAITPRTRLDIVVQKKNGECRKIEYRGDVAGLEKLPKIIKEAISDE
jgi:hypothetical protein